MIKGKVLFWLTLLMGSGLALWYGNGDAIFTKKTWTGSKVKKNEMKKKNALCTSQDDTVEVDEAASGESIIDEKKTETVRTWNTCQNQRDSFELSSKEKSFVVDREKKFLSVLACKNNGKVFRIGLCLSGDGIRSLYAANAILESLERSKLLSSVLFISSLSSSTWLVGSWINSGMAYQSFSHDFLNRLWRLKTLAQALKDVISAKKTTEKSKMILNEYAKILGNIFVPKVSRFSLLASLEEQIERGAMPLPIFAFAAITPPHFAIKSPLWFEMTPYEIACYRCSSAVQTEYFGSFLNSGQLVEKLDGWLLNEAFALCSSLLQLPRFDKKIEHLLARDQNVVKGDLINRSWNTSVEGPFYLLNRMVNNPFFGLKNNICAQLKELSLTDARVAAALPLPALLQRDKITPLDCIIIVDASENSSTITELEKAEVYARGNGLRFPVIKHREYDEFRDKPYAFFGLGSKEAPAILCFSLSKNDVFRAIINDFSCAWQEAFPRKAVPILTEKNYEKLSKRCDKIKGSVLVVMNRLKSSVERIMHAYGFDVNKDGKRAIQKALNVVYEMFNFDPREEMKTGFLTPSNTSYTREQVKQLQGVFRIAFYQALPLLEKEMKKKLGVS